MKIGLVSAILDGWNFEEMIDTVSEMGFRCVEVACWPQGKAERRYAGVSHIDVSELDDVKAAYILDYCKQKNVEISSLAFYPNTMDADLEKRAHNIAHLKKVISASAKLGVNLVTTFIGRDQNKSVEENIELFREIWPDIIAYAAERTVCAHFYMVNHQNQIARLVILVHRACRICQNEVFNSHLAQYPNWKGYFLHGIAFVVMHSALQRDNVLTLKLAEDKPPYMSVHG